MRFAARLPHPCSSGSPDPEPFVIRRSQTTEGDIKRQPLAMDNAGDRPPRYGKKRCPSRRARACPSPLFCCQTSSPCSSGSPDPEPFVIRRSQTTEGDIKRQPLAMDNAGDRPPRYGKKRCPSRRARACPSPSFALREHRDREVAPTEHIETGRSLLPGGNRDREVSPTAN